MVQNGADTNTEHVTVAVILAGIRNGRWQKPVAHVKTRYLSAFQAAKQRGDPDPHKTAKEAVHDIKKKLPGVIATYETMSRMYGLFRQTRRLSSVSESRCEVAFKNYTIGRLVRLRTTRAGSPRTDRRHHRTRST